MLSHRILVASCLVVAALTANHLRAQAPKPKDGPLGMKFVPLPKATFYMGWNGEKGSAKKTEIKEDFEIAIHTVTQGQWQEVMGNNPSFFSRDGKGKDQVKDIKDEDLKHFPVETVSWNDAQEFIKKLNEKAGHGSGGARPESAPERHRAARGRGRQQRGNSAGRRAAGIGFGAASVPTRWRQQGQRAGAARGRGRRRVWWPRRVRARWQ